MSLLSWDTANVWDNSELRIDPDPSFTSCHMFPMKEHSSYENPLKPKAPSSGFYGYDNINSIK